ncbi:MAG: hypothetical protein ACI4V1_05605 [Eubacteriales bacterium]
MENQFLFESVMLDEADSARFSADLAKIVARIQRADAAMPSGAACRPDSMWQRCVPVSDPAPEKGSPDTDIVPVRHEIVADDSFRLAQPLTVPRVVGS